MLRNVTFLKYLSEYKLEVKEVNDKLFIMENLIKEEIVKFYINMVKFEPCIQRKGRNKWR